MSEGRLHPGSLFTCQAGYEDLLAKELAFLQIPVSETAPGWAVAEDGATASPARPDLAFPHRILRTPTEIRGDSVNALAQGILKYFIESLGNERVEGEWPNLWEGITETVGLGRRIGAVAEAFELLLRKRLSRVGKLARPHLPWGVGPARGLFVWFADFGRAFVAREAVLNGQRRMADDPAAPSRSYLKVEEAYSVLGRGPQANETVVDLGAAPGGWSYSAARRGARVIAVDNGPLKEGALNHPSIEHRRTDAFHFAPAAGEHFNWLFSDLVEEPHHVLASIVGPWLERRWCDHFIVNLKFGRVDAVTLLQQLRAHPALSGIDSLRIRHLYHDREEFTLVGSLLPPAALSAELGA